MLSKLKYLIPVLLLVTGLWIIFYLIFSFILRLFTTNKKIILVTFLIFTFANWLIFPAAYYYVFEKVLVHYPIDFLFSLTNSDLFFATGAFLVTGPIGFIVNLKYLMAIL